MELFKQLVQVCRQHYEKILLTLALLGLGAAVWFLTQARQRENEKIQDVQGSLLQRKAKPFAPVDLSAYERAMKTAENPPPLQLAMPHHLFNPVRWQRKPDGQLLKIESSEDVGVAQLKVTKVTPLAYRIVLERIPTPGSFLLQVTDASAVNPQLRRFRRYVTMENRRNETFTLVEVKGTEENPELVLELAANQERVTVSKDQPLERVVGYTVDLKYEVDGRTFPNRRVGDLIRFGGEEYKIVAINEDEVVLSAVQNNKKYAIKITAG